MKKLTAAWVGVVLTATLVTAQNPSRLYTEPALPSTEVLDRLNLKIMWRVYLPTDRRRDGIFSVQVPDRFGQPAQQIFVQTRSGVVLALDASTGTIAWRARFGTPYAVTQLLGYNSKLVFAINGVQLIALSRETGQIQWEFALPHAPAAAPVADEERIFIPLGTGRLYAYELPKPGTTVGPPDIEKKPKTPPEPAPRTPTESPYSRGTIAAYGVTGQSVRSISAVSSRGQMVRSIGPISSALEASRGITLGPQPQEVWNYLSQTRLELAPLVTSEFLLVAGYDGSFIATSKYDGHQLYRLDAGPPLTAPMGQYNETAYVASEDFSCYALDMVAGRVLWRFFGGGPILQKPAVNDDNVYITPRRAGLYSINRKNGLTEWRNYKADRFLAANKKFVYATDSSGRLLILDRARGTDLTVYDGTRDFVVPIANEVTDRLFLASNNGLLICLHDQAYAKPLVMKNVEELRSESLSKESLKPTNDKGEAKKPDKAKGEGEDKKPEK